MRRLTWLAPLLLASTLHAQTVVTPAGTFEAKPGSSLIIEVGDGFVKITWGALPNPTPQPTPTPNPTPVPPTPPAPPPGPVVTADWLLLLFDPGSYTPAHADIQNSKTLRGALAPTKITSVVDGTDDFDRYRPYLKAKGLEAPVYLFMKGQNVIGSGPITTEQAILDAAANLR